MCFRVAVPQRTATAVAPGLPPTLAWSRVTRPVSTLSISPWLLSLALPLLFDKAISTRVVPITWYVRTDVEVCSYLNQVLSVRYEAV